MRRKTYKRLRAAPPQQVQREHIEQHHFFAMLASKVRRYPALAWVYAIPNGARVGPAQAQKLVREGLKSGVSDVCLPFPRGGYHGAYMEFKSPRDPISGKGRGYPSAAQKRFLRHAVTEGYFCAVVDDSQIAFDLTLAYVRGDIKRDERPLAIEQHRRA